MRVLLYNELDPERIRGFDKLRAALQADRFDQADVRKVGPNLFRARLNKRDRLLFSLYRSGGETCCLALEYIPNHRYERSRFLRGDTAIDEDRIPAVHDPERAASEAADLPYVHPHNDRVHLLDKALSFDDEQQQIHAVSPPLVIVGSAGSGKTALTLEKMKEAVGEVLYVTLSPYLAQNARSLYYAHGYANDDQEVTFLSLPEFLETLRVPEGREVQPGDFAAWFRRQPAARSLRDPHKVFEEFRGVITGPVSEQPWLAREDYLELGVKQSIFPESERPQVYDLFEKYLRFLDEAGLYDPNIVSHHYLERAEPCYDFLVVDEVQDITPIQLYLILQTLRSAPDFILTGDANQIVHPNFFSWSALKRLFFERPGLSGDAQALRILRSNYRNGPEITALANRVLKLKHARFGSVDRESNFLVRSVGAQRGALQLLSDGEAVRRELDARTGRSARVAVLVLHPDDKPQAREWFRTPLVFAVQEAKGLEYDSVILFNIVAGEEKAFREIARDVDPNDLEVEELTYRRARDKHDKSLEVLKFYINALYVAVTRAVRNVYWVEADPGHPVLRLLDLETVGDEAIAAEKDDSSVEEWQREARRLEMQGKAEQAQAIREEVLAERPVPWTPLTRAEFEGLRGHALTDGSKKERLEVLEYALLHHHRPTLDALIRAGFKPAQQNEPKALAQLARNRFPDYEFRNPGAILKEAERYGVDHRTRFNLTPLMIATWMGNEAAVSALLARGADPQATANHGFTPLHFAIERALQDPRYARQRLPGLYGQLAPSAVDVQIAGRLVKLDQRLMEYLLLHVFGALQYRHLGPALATGSGAFSAADLAEWLQALPDSVVPAYRKRRTYISGVLSRNEIHRDDPYNRQIFWRLARGHYVINPDLQLRGPSGWLPYYERFPVGDLGTGLPEYDPEFEGIPGGPRHDQQVRARLDEDRRRRLDAFRALLSGEDLG